MEAAMVGMMKPPEAGELDALALKFRSLELDSEADLQTVLRLVKIKEAVSPGENIVDTRSPPRQLTVLLAGVACLHKRLEDDRSFCKRFRSNRRRTRKRESTFTLTALVASARTCSFFLYESFLSTVGNTELMANLAQVALNLESMKKNYSQMLSDAAAQQSQAELDQATYDRYSQLLSSNAIAKMVYDQARFTLQTDTSKLTALRQQAQAQLALLNGNPNAPVAQLPQYMQALAQVHEAQRQLDDAVVRTPFSGTVTQVPSIAPGKYLAASTTAFYLVDTDHVWIDATPKETELTHVLPGQRAVVTVDTYPDIQWHGTVESVSPAAAQQFSLLPAQNTSGNWVKVVQRVPLRVRVDRGKGDPSLLRAGMSVEVSIDTGHARGLPKFVTNLFRWAR